MYLFFYIRVFYLNIINFIVNILTPMWYPFIKPFRHKARSVVYSYAIKNNIFIYNLNPLKRVTYKGYSNKTIDYLVYSWYKYVIWIWLNDLLDYDVVDSSTIIKYMVAKQSGELYIVHYEEPLLAKGDYPVYMGNLDYLHSLVDKHTNYEYMYMYDKIYYSGFYFLGFYFGHHVISSKYDGYVYKNVLFQESPYL